MESIGGFRRRLSCEEKIIFMKTSQSKLAVTPKMYETENDISKSSRLELCALLNLRLASLVDLQMQMKQAHWNVKGPSFIGLHELFDKVAEDVEDYVDLVAERIVQLGGIAEGTVRVASSRTRLPEYPLNSRRAWRMSTPWPARFPLLGRKPAKRLMKRMHWTTPTRRICSPRFRAA